MSKKLIASLFLLSSVLGISLVRAEVVSDRDSLSTIQDLQQKNQQNGNYSSHQLELLDLINNVRTENGLSSLSFSSDLTVAAQNHVSDLINNNIFGHAGSDGSSVADRVLKVGYDYSSVGENVAAGNETPAKVFQQWMDSPGHRDNMLATDYQEVGISYVLDVPNTTYSHYWVLVLGQEF